MNNVQLAKSNHLYTTYMVLGALYVLIKIAFVSAGCLHLGAIFHGLIPAVIAVAVGFLALAERNKSNGRLWHFIMVVVPVLIFITTPIYMYVRERADWLTNGRLQVLVIYEVIAVVQFIIASKRLKAVR